jgi:hypothetical protein
MRDSTTPPHWHYLRHFGVTFARCEAWTGSSGW